jgi:uncharacterized membrane protein YhaH (DUF805 family)
MDNGRLMSSPFPAYALAERMPPTRLYLSLDGRIDRRCFWLRGVLALLAVALVLNLLLQIAGLQAERADYIANLLLAWPFIAVSAKRWHDRDRSAWWVLVLAIPLIGTLWTLIDNGFVRGTPGPNRFGEPPTD